MTTRLKGAPSWDEAWAEIDVATYLDAISERDEWQAMFEEAEAVAWSAFLDTLPPDQRAEVAALGPEQIRDAEPALQRSFSVYHLDAMEVALKDELRLFYDIVLEQVEGTVADRDVYRLIYLDKDQDPRDVQQLGVYWSERPDRVGYYASGDPSGVRAWRFHALSSADNVDVSATVHARLDPYYGDDEYEATMLTDAPVYVVEAEEVLGYPWWKKDAIAYSPDVRIASPVPIEAWRQI